MKFKLTANKKQSFGITLFQIEATASFGDVIKGELGGYVEKKENLSEDGDAWVSGDALVSGNARVSAKVAFTLGWFFGGDDSGKITDITDKTGSDYWKNQYVLGDYKIEPIEDEQVIKKNPTEITIEGATYRLVEND